MSPAIRGQHVELHFAATFYQSHVWLNGKLLGTHEGGHTPYWFDISSTLRPGDNFLAVELDNRPTAQTIPGFALRLRDTWELRDRDGNALASGEQAIPDLQQAVLVRGTWVAGASLPLHLQIAFLDAKENSEATTVLDAYPLNFSGQGVDDMKQTPH